MSSIMEWGWRKKKGIKNSKRNLAEAPAEGAALGLPGPGRFINWFVFRRSPPCTSNCSSPVAHR
jgi:hypothetical protein